MHLGANEACGKAFGAKNPDLAVTPVDTILNVLDKRIMRHLYKRHQKAQA